jgi:hypothetical protein
MPFPDAYPPPPDDSDKHEHALAGAAFRFGLEDLDAPPLARLLGPAAIASLKEAFDLRDPAHHTPDAEDALATLLGASLAYRNDRLGLSLVPTLSRDEVSLSGVLRW